MAPVAQHAHDQGDAAARADEQQLGRRLVEEQELALHPTQGDDRARAAAPDQVRRDLALSTFLTVMLIRPSSRAVAWLLSQTYFLLNSNIRSSRFLYELSGQEARADEGVRATRRAGTRGMPRSLREQLILQVAGQVFAQGGYDRAAMDRIAELAGVSKPMLYAYFGSKEGLYLAYVERTGAELVQRLVGVGVQRGEPRRLRPVIDEFLAFVEEHRDGWTVLFRELNASLPLAEQVAQLRSEIVAEVRRMLEREDVGSPPSLTPPASEGVAEAIVGAGESLANWWLKKPSVPREDVVDWYVGLARAAISSASAR